MNIRDATAADLPEILAIYNDAVLTTTAIWNESVVDLENRLAWFSDRRRSGYPILVAEDAGEVIGYASLADFRAAEGYRYTVEQSIYIGPDRRGTGVGRALLAPLTDRARLLGKHVIVAGIESSNLPSLRLHARLGFVQVGQLKEVGAKFGRWLDLIFMQRTLDHTTFQGFRLNGQ
jgi:L-amino acid N-acyltransferase YncA